jgi:hypothetical protein
VVVGVAVIGFFLGGLAAAAFAPRAPADSPDFAEYVPLPHHVPAHQGGVAFRFAMVHDVVHERYPRHGPAYYRERDRLAREKLAALRPDVPLAFTLTDDVAGGLDRVGRSDEAVDLMRQKLQRQQAAGEGGAALYTTYANLGTFLTHANFEKAARGDALAGGRFREGVEFIHKAIEANPQAHYGREAWQAAFAEFLDAAMTQPQRLKTFDCLGNRLDADAEKILMRQEAGGSGRMYGRAYTMFFAESDKLREAADARRAGPLDDPDRWESLKGLREYVTPVGAEEGWADVPVPSHRKPAPFDEAALGLVGMWRQTDGPNPHFALALGETMLRVGQRFIAWAAYERAALLADRFWPSEEQRQFLRDHCRKRQAAIEQTLRRERPGDGAVEGSRPAFEAELAHGQDYQRAYQRYEEEKIAAGAALDDAKFYDDFESGREPIASPSGSEEWYVYVSDTKRIRRDVTEWAAWGAVGAGLAAMAMALALRFVGRPRPA